MSKEKGINPPLGWIDVLRHLLSLAVIFQHMSSANRYPAELNVYISNIVPALDGAVACFFLLSGFLAHSDFSWRTLTAQARRLLLPYILFCVLYGTILVLLNKLTIAQVAWRTVSGSGVGPQLYFLPYLFLIWTAINYVLSKGGKFLAAFVLLGLFCAYLAISTPSSTGPEPKLLILYALAYTIGYYRARYAGKWEIALVTAMASLGVMLISFQSRYFDLALIILLLEAVVLLSRKEPLPMRLPGSGGVYLLHTPLLNFAISTILWKLHVISVANIFVTMALTYLAALAITLAFRQVTKRYRWLILE